MRHAFSSSFAENASSDSPSSSPLQCSISYFVRFISLSSTENHVRLTQKENLNFFFAGNENFLADTRQ